MLVDVIDAAMDKQAAERQQTNKIGAHNVGQCVRKLWYTVHGYPGEALNGRALRVFDLGNRVEDAILEFLVKADVVHIRGTREQDAVYVDEIGGRVVPDFMFEHAGEQLVGEIKSMSDFAFDRAERGYVDDSYLWQMEVYMRAFNTQRALLVAYRKETSHLTEVLVARDDARWEKIKAAVQAARADDPPARPYEAITDCEDCGGSGKTPAKGLPHKACNGTGVVPYGPHIPRFPCGYCAFKDHCWGKLTQAFDPKGRPVWKMVA